MVHEHATARFELIFVDKGQHRDIVLEAYIRSADRVLVVNNLFEIANSHGGPAHLVNLVTLLLVFLILGLQSLLVLDEFFLHQQVVLNTLLPKESQPAL